MPKIHWKKKGLKLSRIVICSTFRAELCIAATVSLEVRIKRNNYFRVEKIPFHVFNFSFVHQKKEFLTTFLHNKGAES